MAEITQIEQLAPLLQSQRDAFNAFPYPDYSTRLADLKKLKALLIDNKQAFIDAAAKDFGHRATDDTIIGDIFSSIQGINYSIKHLKGWMKPQRRHVAVTFQPASAQVLHQPLGVVGVIVPWNYPIFLALGPLTAAMAAGNRVMIKMSESTPETSRVLAEVLAQGFEQDQVCVVGGEADVAAAFSSLQFDHLFFTGSTSIGKLVMQSAAKNLVPVTLELGGKSPSIIAPDMPVKTAVERFILGKTLNAGQTCVAPDYILVESNKVEELVDALKVQYGNMYPDFCNNKDCTAVVNDRQYSRHKSWLEDAKEKGATIIPLADNPNVDETRQMPLTLVLNVTDEMTVMQEEIFGPILPIKEYGDFQQALDYVNARPRPLALYLYSFDSALQESVKRQTHAGGMGINDAAFHVAVDDLPFGGIGTSGMGSYHGVEGFKTFSHAKAVFKRGKLNFTTMLFPPFGKPIHNLFYKLFLR